MKLIHILFILYKLYLVFRILNYCGGVMFFIENRDKLNDELKDEGIYEITKKRAIVEIVLFVLIWLVEFLIKLI